MMGVPLVNVQAAISSATALKKSSDHSSNLEVSRRNGSTSCFAAFMSMSSMVRNNRSFQASLSRDSSAFRSPVCRIRAAPPGNDHTGRSGPPCALPLLPAGQADLVRLVGVHALGREPGPLLPEGLVHPRQHPLLGPLPVQEVVSLAGKRVPLNGQRCESLEARLKTRASTVPRAGARKAVRERIETMPAGSKCGPGDTSSPASGPWVAAAPPT